VTRLARRVIAGDVVVRGAARHFRAHGTLDMDLLATELAVSRATLYRVVGNRDALLGDALWLLARRLLDAARRGRRRSGADGVIEVSRRFAAGVRSAAPLRRFITAEPQTAARLLFTAAGEVHCRAVRAQHQLFVEAGLAQAGLDVACLYVRIVESVLFGDLFRGPRVDFAVAERALRALLPASGKRAGA
jgi:hypothetical protein